METVLETVLSHLKGARHDVFKQDGSKYKWLKIAQRKYAQWLAKNQVFILQLILNNCFGIIFRAEQRELRHKNTDGIVCLFVCL